MKLYIALETKKTIEEIFETALTLKPFTDGFVINNTILYHHGVAAVKEFKKTFPDTYLFVDSKITEHGSLIATMLADAGANCISVMAGARQGVIHTTAQTARDRNCMTMLDLTDSCAPGQSALEAKSLGIYSLFLHISHEESLENNSTKFTETWQLLRGNSSLPIFLGGRIEPDFVTKAKEIDAEGIIVGKVITHAQDPVKEAEQFFMATR